MDIVALMVQVTQICTLNGPKGLDDPYRLKGMDGLDGLDGLLFLNTYTEHACMYSYMIGFTELF